MPTSSRSVIVGLAQLLPVRRRIYVATFTTVLRRVLVRLVQKNRDRCDEPRKETQPHVLASTRGNVPDKESFGILEMLRELVSEPSKAQKAEQKDGVGRTRHVRVLSAGAVGGAEIHHDKRDHSQHELAHPSVLHRKVWDGSATNKVARASEGPGMGLRLTAAYDCAAFFPM